MTAQKEIPARELEKEIIVFLTRWATKPGGKRTKPGCNLRHGNACVLATCHDNIPRATPVDFFCDGSLAIWIIAEPGGKIANIMRNPNVAVGIHEKVDHSIEQKSLQVWGTAEVINLKNSPAVFNEKMASFGLDEAMPGMLEELSRKGTLPDSAQKQALEKIRQKINILKIMPEKITLLHMQPDALPAKKIWENGKAFIQDMGM
jgi:nitroimidazol reductase NimA-like FMN-containing flavoprotein (pyridoxamine 5'-phosphate oxidase superfamily)